MRKKSQARSSRRILASLLAASMLASMLPLGALTASAAAGVKDTLDADRPTASNQLVQYVDLDSVSAKSGSHNVQPPDNTGAEGPRKLFDGDTTTKLGINKQGNEDTVEVSWKMTTPVALTYYTLAGGNDSEGRDPKSWTLYGSVDGAEYTPIDTVENATLNEKFPEDYCTYYPEDYAVDSGRAYTYYKIAFTAYRGNEGFFQISELALSGYVLSNDPIRYEVEDLKDTGKISKSTDEIEIGKTATDGVSGSPSGGAYVNIGLKAAGNYAIFELDGIPATGLYRVSAAFKAHENSATVALAKDYAQEDSRVVGPSINPAVNETIQRNAFNRQIPKLTVEVELQAGTDTVEVVGLANCDKNIRLDYIELQPISAPSVHISADEAVKNVASFEPIGDIQYDFGATDEGEWYVELPEQNDGPKLMIADTASTSGEFSADVQVTGSGPVGFVIKGANLNYGADAFDGYEVGFTKENEQPVIRLGRHRNNFTKLQDFSYTPSGTGWENLKVVYTANFYEFFVNGSSVGTYTDQAPEAVTSGQVGLRAWAGSGRYKNIQVKVEDGDPQTIAITSGLKGVTSGSIVKPAAGAKDETSPWGTIYPVWFNDGKAGDKVSITADVEEAGDYLVYFKYKAYQASGKVQVAVNGANVGEPVDCYAPNSGDTNARKHKMYYEAPVGVANIGQAGKVDITFTLQQDLGTLILQDITLVPLHTIPMASDGTLVHYDFVTGAKDVSGNGYNGMLTGSAGTSAGLLQLSGGYLQMPVETVSQAKTISMMVRASEIRQWTTLFEAGPNGDNAVQISAQSDEGGRLGLALTIVGKGDTDEQKTVRLMADKPLNIHEWTEITFTKEGDSAALYLNGEKVHTTLIVGGQEGESYEGRGLHEITSGAASVGGPAIWMNDPTLKGVMADFRMYDRVLSDAEVMELYQENKAALPAEEPVTAQVPDSVLHYTFDGLTADGKVEDVAGDYDGTIVNYDNNPTTTDKIKIEDGMVEFLSEGGRSDRVSIPIAALKHENITVSMMVNANKYVGDYATYFQAGSRHQMNGEFGEGAYLMRWQPFFSGRGNNLQFYVDNVVADKAYNAASPYKMPLQNWVQLTFTLSADGEIVMYFNGEAIPYTASGDGWDQVAKSVLSFANLPDDGMAAIGAATKEWGDVDPGMNGKMSDFRVFDKVLSAEEVAALTAENLQEADPRNYVAAETLDPVALDAAGGVYNDFKVGQAYCDQTYTFAGKTASFGCEPPENSYMTINLKVPNQAVTFSGIVGMCTEGLQNGYYNNDNRVEFYIDGIKAGEAGPFLKDGAEGNESGDKGYAAFAIDIPAGAQQLVLKLNNSNRHTDHITFFDTGFYLDLDAAYVPARITDVVKLIAGISDTITYKSLEELTQVRAAYDALSEEEQAQVHNIQRLIDAEATLQQIQDDFTFTINDNWPQMVVDNPDGEGKIKVDVTFDNAPWLAALKDDPEGYQATRDAMVKAVREKLIYDAYGMGVKPGATVDMQYMNDGANRALAVQLEDTSEGAYNDSIGSPWNHGRNEDGTPTAGLRRWNAVYSPFVGMAFTRVGAMAMGGGDAGTPIGEAFEYGGKIVQMTFGGGMRRVDAKEYTINDSSPTGIDGWGYGPGVGLEGGAKMAFQYTYAKYDWDSEYGMTLGMPSYQDVQKQVDGIYYQDFEGPQGRAIMAGSKDILDAIPADDGTPEGCYYINGAAYDAFMSLGNDAAARFAITGAPTGNTIISGDSASQTFEKGVLTAKSGEYSFEDMDETVLAAINAIAAIPQPVELSSACKEAIDAARAAYNEVAEENRVQVINADELTAAEAEYARLEKLAAAEAVEEQIEEAANLENSADLEALRSKVEAAKTAYGELDATQQAMVTNYGKIAELEAGIEAVESVQEQISELPAVADINEENAAENNVKVKAAQAAVEALAEYGKFISETDKQLLSDLEEAIKPYIKSDAVVAVEELIGAIPESDLTYKDAGAIWKAKHAYDALSAEDQGDVDATLVGKLTTAMEFAETLTVDDSKITDDVSSWNDEVNLSPWMNNSNLTQEEKLAVIETMRDENAFQYTHEGYDLGFQSTDLNRKMQVQEGLVYVEVDNSGDTKPGCNPWAQANRRWAAIVAPFEGVAFSIKSPFGYLGVAQSLLLSNTFEYNGRVYQLTWNEVHSYDASMSIDEITADYMQNKILDENGEPVAKSIEAIFPGMQTVEEVAEDVTNNTFRYAAARYNQAVKWDGKTLGIPSGEVVTGESVLYQKFEGPQGEAYIIGNKADVELADANEPAAVAYVVTGEDLEAIKAVNADLGTAMETVGAPIEEKPEDGSAWRFTNGRIENGVFTAYTAIEKFELLLEKTVQTAMTDEAEYEAAKAAYEAAAAAYEALGSEQSEVPAESVERLENAGAMVEKYETDRAAADEMIERLNELPYRITDIDEAAEAEIASARADYDDLNAEVKEMVGAATYDYLVEAEDTLAAKEFVDLYEGLQVPENYAEEWADLDPETYEESKEYLTYVAPLEEPYGALNDRQQDKVDEYDGEMLGAIEALLAWRPDVDDIVLGDLDKDGEVTIADVMEACKVMARESAGTDPTDEEIERGDMDGDSEITIADVMEICKVLARQSA